MFSPLLLSVPFTKLVLAHSLTCELTRGHGCSEPSARAKSAGIRPGGLRSKVKKTRFGFSRLLPAGIEVACCHQPTTALRRACFCNCCLPRATFHASAATEIGNIYCSAIVVAASVIMKSRHEVVRGPRSSVLESARSVTQIDSLCTCVSRFARHAQDVALCARSRSSSTSCCHCCASASSHSSCSLRLGSVALVEPVVFVERVASRFSLRRRLSLARFRWRLRELLPLLAPRPVLPSPAGIANVLLSSSGRDAPDTVPHQIRKSCSQDEAQQQPLNASCRRHSGSAARSLPPSICSDG